LDKVPPYTPYCVPGAIEGESLQVISKTGNVRPQEIPTRNSGDKNLWWTKGKPGDKLILGFNVNQAGRKRVIIRCVKAKNYAKVSMYVNGQKAYQPIDLYHGRRNVTKNIDLGEFDLQKGHNTLTIEIIGANDKAVKSYMFGLDYIMLK
jgi:hypothetical protein